MYPRLLDYPHVSSYPVLLLLGIAAGWFLARKRARTIGIEPRHIDNISLLIPLLGLAGARFFARLFYAKLPVMEAVQVWKGDGLVFYGGFIACTIGVITYAIVSRIPLIKLLDLLAPSAALGLAFGRIGCFMAGCCWGDFCVSSQQLAGLPPERIVQVQTIPSLSGEGNLFAVEFPRKSDVFKTQAKWGLIEDSSARSLPVHAVQLYEAALAFALCGYLLLKSLKGVSPGTISLLLLSGYALIRFATELLRGDNKLNDAGLTFSQEVSIYILLFCALCVLWQRVLIPKNSSRTTPLATISGV